MSTWTLDNVKKMIGRQCGDPKATGYSSAIKDHLINAIESLAEDIVAIADIDRALTDDDRKRYSEVINISENEIYPMLTEVPKIPSYSNKVASFSITNSQFVKVIKVRDIFINPQIGAKIRFFRLMSMVEFNRHSTNPHLIASEGEIFWLNLGNKIWVYNNGSGNYQLYFHCLTSLDYSGWTDSTNLQVLGFGTNFLTNAISRAAYTMRLQLGFEKE